MSNVLPSLTTYVYLKKINVFDTPEPSQTVGALLSRAYTAGGCILGAIFGTGTNGAYVEEVGKFKRFLITSPC